MRRGGGLNTQRVALIAWLGSRLAGKAGQSQAFGDLDSLIILKTLGYSLSGATVVECGKPSQYTGLATVDEKSSMGCSVVDAQ